MFKTILALLIALSLNSNAMKASIPQDGGPEHWAKVDASVVIWAGNPPKPMAPKGTEKLMLVWNCYELFIWRQGKPGPIAKVELRKDDSDPNETLYHFETFGYIRERSDGSGEISEGTVDFGDYLKVYKGEFKKTGGW